VISKQFIPILFILAPNMDPVGEISKFSKEFNLSDENLPKKSVGVGMDQ